MGERAAASFAHHARGLFLRTRCCGALARCMCRRRCCLEGASRRGQEEGGQSERCTQPTPTPFATAFPSSRPAPPRPARARKPHQPPALVHQARAQRGAIPPRARARRAAARPPHAACAIGRATAKGAPQASRSACSASQPAHERIRQPSWCDARRARARRQSPIGSATRSSPHPPIPIAISTTGTRRALRARCLPWWPGAGSAGLPRGCGLARLCADRPVRRHLGAATPRALPHPLTVRPTPVCGAGTMVEMGGAPLLRPALSFAHPPIPPTATPTRRRGAAPLAARTGVRQVVAH